MSITAGWGNGHAKVSGSGLSGKRREYGLIGPTVHPRREAYCTCHRLGTKHREDEEDKWDAGKGEVRIAAERGDVLSAFESETMCRAQPRGQSSQDRNKARAAHRSASLASLRNSKRAGVVVYCTYSKSNPDMAWVGTRDKQPFETP
jgi:hypothetical protein